MDALYFTYQNACQLIIIRVLRMISHMARLKGHLSNHHFLRPPEHVFYVVSRNRASPEHAFYVFPENRPPQNAGFRAIQAENVTETRVLT